MYRELAVAVPVLSAGMRATIVSSSRNKRLFVIAVFSIRAAYVVIRMRCGVMFGSVWLFVAVSLYL